MMEKLVIAKQIPISKCILTTWTIFITCIAYVSSQLVIRVVITIRPTLVLNQTQIITIFNTLQEYFNYPFLLSWQLVVVSADRLYSVTRQLRPFFLFSLFFGTDRNKERGGDKRLGLIQKKLYQITSSSSFSAILKLIQYKMAYEISGLTNDVK